MKKSFLFIAALMAGLTVSAQSVTVVEDLAAYDGNDTYVFNQKDGKTYVLNNLGAYERYGLYEKVTNLIVSSATGTQEVGYIAAPDGAYIDLNYLPKSNTKIEAVFKASQGPDWKALYGTRFEANTQNGVEFPGTSNYSAGNGWKSGFAFFPTNGAINLGGETIEKGKMVFGEKVKTIQDAATGKLDIYTGENLNVLANTIQDSPLSGNLETSLYIFAINKHLPVIEGYNTDPNAFGANSDPCYNPFVTLYSLKIYEGETLVYDLVPVTSEGKGGLKDKVSGTVYTSANDKEFELSPDNGTSVYEGKMVFNTTDGKVYKYNGTTWEDLGTRTMAEIANDNYKDMNNWVTNDGHMSIFRDKWQATANGYKIDPYVGTGGHEPLMIKIDTEEDADYNYSFTSSWGQYGSWHGVEMHAYVANFWDLGTQESGLIVGGSVLATQTFAFAGGTDVAFSLDFTADRADQTLVMQFGDVDDGEKGFWFEFDNLSVKKYGYPEAYPSLNPFGPQLAILIPEVESAALNTTDVLASALDQALVVAKAVADSEDLAAQKTALENLQSAYEKAKAINISVLENTVPLAKAEGVSTTAAEDFMENGTSVDVLNNMVYALRAARKLNAATTIDPTAIEGSEPANGEFYLLNVGTGLFLNTTADWGTHVSIDNPGMLINLVQDEFGKDGLPAFKISGNGWDGFNWTEEYWDKNGEHKSAFRPVAGKDKVYYWNVFDNFDWHFVYDVNDGECDGGTKYWNAVQKRQWNPNDYADNENAQWKLVTKDQLLAALAKATQEKPMDATFMIENPNFTKFGGKDVKRGWEGAGDVKSADRDAFYVIEFWQKSINMKQTIEGLPAGLYQVSVNGFYRDGTTVSETQRANNDEILSQMAFLVASNGEGESVSTALPNVSSEAGNMPGVGDVINGLELANWPWQANEYFQTGLYKTTTKVIEVGKDGKLTIGIEKENAEEPADNWVVIDNFRLTYLGESNTTAISSMETQQNEQPAIYNMQGMRMQQATKGLYIIGGKKVVK